MWQTLAFLFTFLLSCKTSLDAFGQPVETPSVTFEYQVIYLKADDRLIPALSYATSRWYVTSGISFRFDKDYGLPITIEDSVIIDGQPVRGATYWDDYNRPIKIEISFERFNDGFEQTSRTLTHELGHALGVSDHILDDKCIMKKSTDVDSKITTSVLDVVCRINVCLWKHPEKQ